MKENVSNVNEQTADEIGLSASSCCAPIVCDCRSTGYDDLPDTLESISSSECRAKYYSVIDKTTGKLAVELGHPIYVNTKAGFYIDMGSDRNPKIGFHQNLEIRKMSREP